MDEVPLDFIERVTATCKCNNELPVFSDRKWTFSKPRNVDFRIGVFDGVWKYYFCIDYRNFTMSGLLEHPDFKNLRAGAIQVNETRIDGATEPVSNVGMAKLLNFVSFLANEPEVWFHKVDAGRFRSSEGAMLFEWLAERSFSKITFFQYESIYNSIISYQLSSRNPIDICMCDANDDTRFFAAHLRSGELTRFTAYVGVFSAAVMEGIVQSFLDAPSKKEIKIEASFVESTTSRLLEMEKRGLCKIDWGTFVFENRFQKLRVWRTDFKASNYYSVRYSISCQTS